jgi:hypothetical protein
MKDPFNFPSFDSAFNFSSRAATHAPKQRGLKGPALQTPKSNLEKFFNVLSKPGAIERKMAINAIQGQPITSGVQDIFGWDDNSSFLKNLNNVVSATKAYEPSGGDLIQAIRGGQDPTGKLGKIGQAVGGFVLDVLNPADPLNWIGIGELTGAGKLARDATKTPGFVKGLMAGERSFASMTVPFTKGAVAFHTPRAVNRMAGTALKGVGDTLMAIKPIKAMAENFKPAFNELRTWANKRVGGAAMALEKIMPEKFTPMEKQFASGIKKIRAGDFAKINPEMSAWYATKNLKPDEIFHKEAIRIKEMPKIREREAGGYSDMMDEHKKAFTAKVPHSGDTLPEIKAYAKKQMALERLTAAKAKNIGIPVAKETGFTHRVLSQETKMKFEELGINVEHGDRKIHELTTAEIEEAKNDPELRAKLYKLYITKDDIAKNPQLADAIKQADPKAAPFYEIDSLKSHELYMVGMMHDISTANILGDMVRNNGIARLTPEAWDTAGSKIPIRPVAIPDMYKKSIQGAFNSDKPVDVVYVPENIEKEFKNFMDIFTDQQKAQKVFGAMEGNVRAINQLWKELTLLTGIVPSVGIRTALRDAFSNSLQSIISGAWSLDGFGAATAAVYKKMLGKGDGKLGIRDGIDLDQHWEIFRNANMLEEGFTKGMVGNGKMGAVKTALGMSAIRKFRQISESHARFQHYITRIKQGFASDAAIHDVRRIQYDYMGGLSPNEKRIQNFIPFYAWSRFNIPMMIEQTLRYPGRVAGMNRAKQNIESTTQSNKPDERALDEYISGDPHIRLWQDPKTGKWTYLRLKGFVPMGDLEDISGMSKFLSMMMSSLTPMIKTPMENMTNQSTFFKTAGGYPAAIENFPGQTGPFLGMDITRKHINILRNLRPLNEINKMFFNTGKQGLSPFEYGISSAGAGLTPIDIPSATQNAQYAYLKQLSALKMAKKRQEQKGRTTKDIDARMQELKNQSYQP